MKCIACDKEATKVIRPDLDLTGIGMCEDHEKEVTFYWVEACVTKDFTKFENKFINNKNKKNGDNGRG